MGELAKMCNVSHTWRVMRVWPCAAVAQRLHSLSSLVPHYVGSGVMSGTKFFFQKLSNSITCTKSTYYIFSARLSWKVHVLVFLFLGVRGSNLPVCNFFSFFISWIPCSWLHVCLHGITCMVPGYIHVVAATSPALVYQSLNRSLPCINSYGHPPCCRAKINLLWFSPHSKHCHPHLPQHGMDPQCTCWCWALTPGNWSMAQKPALELVNNLYPCSQIGILTSAGMTELGVSHVSN